MQVIVCHFTFRQSRVWQQQSNPRKKHIKSWVFQEMNITLLMVCVGCNTYVHTKKTICHNAHHSPNRLLYGRGGTENFKASKVRAFSFYRTGIYGEFAGFSLPRVSGAGLRYFGIILFRKNRNFVSSRCQ